MNPIELLASAKTLDLGKTAINFGADAVTIAAPTSEGGSMSLDEIRFLAAYAHKYWARVYVTLQSLRPDEDVSSAQTLIHELYESGVDGLILQDERLLELDLPPLPLFASPHVSNQTPERVAFLEKAGFQRVLLSPELTLEQIRAIRAKTKIDLEIFVHGELCASTSGQCDPRRETGAPGEPCAQFCRQPFNLLDRAGKRILSQRYLLSLRDLNLSGDLGALLEAGVTSLRMESSQVDPSYWMNGVALYRQKLDALLEKRELRASSSGRMTFDFTPDPRKTFNHGFTRYFLHGRKEPVGSPDTPNSPGEPLGRVAQLGKDFFTLDGAAEAHPGDVLCFFGAERVLTTTAVSEVKEKSVFPEKLDGLVVGTLVFRSYDRVFMDTLKNSKTARKIAVRFRLAPTRDGLALFAQDGEGNEGMFAIPLEYVAADDPEKAAAALEAELRKLGGTEFECTFVRDDLPVPLTIPFGAISALRRGALEDLAADRMRNFPRAVRSAGIRSGVHLELPSDSGQDLNGKRVMTSKHCIKHQMGWCKTYPNPKAPPSTSPEEPLMLVDEQGKHHPLRFRCPECVMEIIINR